MQKRFFVFYFACAAASALLSLVNLSYADNMFSSAQQQFYVAGDAGVFHGNFNGTYNDTTDLIPMNVSSTYSQNGMTGGLGLGYTATLNHKYLLGAEIVQSFNSTQGTFNESSSNGIFSDKTSIKNNLDLLFQPGVMITDSFAAYLNTGLSIGAINNQVVSQTDFISPTYVTVNDNKHVTGFVLGLGARDYLTQKLSVFTEYNYHDYGTTNFTNFQNLTSTYSHSVRITSSALTFGAAWNF